MIAVADGAGSAPRAAEGSQLAVAAAVYWAGRGITDPASILSRARTCLRTWAGGTDAMRDFATTLSVAILNQRTLRVAQVGDGAVVVLDDAGGLDLLRASDDAEYLNETVFLTSRHWREQLACATRPARGISGVAVLSDGLQLLALDMGAAQPHAGFFNPLFDFAADADASADELATFLASPRVSARTDDDSTLVLAAAV
jgi:hypothetical protein